METLTINQFARRFVAGYEVRPDPTWKDQDNKSGYLLLKKPGGGVSEVKVFDLPKKVAIEQKYREYLYRIAHEQNMANARESHGTVVYATDSNNPYRHAYCGGKVAFEVNDGETDSHLWRGFCQSCGVSGLFVARTPHAATFSKGLDKDQVFQIPAEGIVDTENTIRLTREQLMDVISRAKKIITEQEPGWTVSYSKMLLVLSDGGRLVYGVPANIIVDLCDILDRGQVIILTVDDTGKTALWESGGNSVSTLKLVPPLVDVFVTVGSGRAVRTKKETISRIPFALDFDAKPAVDGVELDKWIAKALPFGARKKELASENRVQLLHHFGTFATDGHRIHMDTSLTPISHKDKNIETPDLTHILESAKKAEILAELDASQVTKAVRSLKGHKEAIILRFDETELTFIVNGDESAGQTSIPYKPMGMRKKSHQRINANYLLKALSGFRGRVELVMVWDHMLCLRQGTRMALISLMILE